jgi:hypothetical protein
MADTVLDLALAREGREHWAERFAQADGDASARGMRRGGKPEREQAPGRADGGFRTKPQTSPTHPLSIIRSPSSILLPTWTAVRYIRDMNTAFRIMITLALVVGLGCQGKAQGRSTAKDKAAAEAKRASPSATGPTVQLSYGEGTLRENPIQSFMYFVPLISPVDVDRGTSNDNHQQVSIVSYEKKVTSKSFHVDCEFKIEGSGFSRYTFDPTGMIALRIAESKKPNPDSLSNLLDYITFEGEGFGGIQIKGTINGPAQTVTEVELEFNARGGKSPVAIGLYELKAKNGQYRYENRSDEIVARVNSLAFKRGENPRMSITVASISKKAKTGGFVGQIKAAIANLFIKPVKITPLGNETLLNFGYALFEQKPTFTFPKAPNLKEPVILAAEPNAQ